MSVSKLPVALALLVGATALSLGGASCKKNSPPGTQPTDDGGVSAKSASPPVVISAAATDGGIGPRPRTTSWSISGPGLDGDIDYRLKRKDMGTDQELYLVELILKRAQYLSNVADYEKADALTTAMVAAHPNDPYAHFARAVSLGAFHKFDDEMKQLDLAATTKDRGLAARIPEARATVLLTLGRYDEAEKLMKPIDAETHSAIALTVAAVLAGHMQKIDESDRLFERARQSLVDVSPFPVAWMDFQRGLMLEARGKEAQARLYYAEAAEAIPDYVHAGVHLAATDKPEDAIKRLEALRKVSTDPDILAGLADAYKKTKKDAQAKELVDKAKETYEQLLAKHPEAYRDHAARFYLGVGNDPKKALELAEKNATLRQTEEAIDLWMGTAAAADRKDAICKSAAAMNKLRWASEPRKRLAAAAMNGCPEEKK